MKCVTMMLAAGLILNFATLDAWARPGGRPAIDPETLAARCVEHIESVTERATERNRRATARCVAEIDELLLLGDEEGAAELADRCIGFINGASERSITHIERDARKCVSLLNRLEATELAERVAAAAESAVATVEESQRASVAEIEAALSGGIPE